MARDLSSRRDVFGRDISYICSALPDFDLWNMIDVYSKEPESGYSPMHITILKGQLRKSFMLYKSWKEEKEYLTHKFGGHIMNQLDREGLTPLDLHYLNLNMILQRYPKELALKNLGSNRGNRLPQVRWIDVWESLPSATEDCLQSLVLKDLNKIRNTGGTHILTFGSNIHSQLGTGSKDDRKKMFQIHSSMFRADKTHSINDVRFRKISMRKYYSTFITSDNRVYTCGNGSRGRLGTGDTENVSGTFQLAFDLDEIGIREMVNSDHHTLLIDEAANLYSWGWNAYGQLGYSSPSVKKQNQKLHENIFIAVPRRVTSLDNYDIKLIGCSNIHSCIVTKDNIVMIWGLNIGQMGFVKSNYLDSRKEYMSYEGSIINKPTNISIPKIGAIEQVICTEFATILRCHGNVIHVLSDYSIRTFRIPLARYKAHTTVDPFHQFAAKEIPNEILSIKCSNMYGNYLGIQYSCGRIGVLILKNEGPKCWNGLSNVLPVIPCWMPKFRFNNCADFDISSKGGIIVSTVRGETFISGAPSSPFEKIFDSKLISGNACQVSCDSTFGSFIISKHEKIHLDMKTFDDTLESDLLRYSYSILSCASETEVCNVVMTPSYREDSSAERISSEKKFRNCNHIDKKLRWHSNPKFDVTFISEDNERTIFRCHKVILFNRCRHFTKCITRDKIYSLSDGLIQFRYEGLCEGGIMIIRVLITSDRDRNQKMLKSILNRLYTDQKPSSSQEAFIHLNLIDTPLQFCFSQLLESSVGDLANVPDYIQELLDVQINLLDGSTKAHALVLASRCAYFANVFSSPFPSQRSDGLITLQLTKFTKRGFDLLLQYIYGVPFESIINKHTSTNSVEALDLYLELLELADYLNIDILRLNLEWSLQEYINGDQVLSIFIAAIAYGCNRLAYSCAFYILMHLGLIYCIDKVDLVDQYMTPEAWNFLEKTLHSLDKTQLTALHNKDWTNVSDTDWIKLFSHNMNSFNQKFMAKNAEFQPIIEVGTSITNIEDNFMKHKSKTHVSLASTGDDSVGLNSAKHLACRKESSVKQIDEKAHYKSSSIVQKQEAFTAVNHKKKRSSKPIEINNGSALCDPPDISSDSKIVVHSQFAAVPLPSLFSETTSKTDNGQSLKLSGTFRKSTQRTRKHNLNKSESKEFNSNKNQMAWSNQGASQAKKECSHPTSSSLPSLLHTDSKDLRIKNNKGAKSRLDHIKGDHLLANSVWNAKAGGIKTGSNVGTLSSSTMTLEERVAARRFEDWFSNESAKVQSMLNQNETSQHNLEAMYIDDNIPNFLTYPNNKKPPKKIKAKFSNKLKSDISSLNNFL